LKVMMYISDELNTKMNDPFCKRKEEKQKL